MNVLYWIFSNQNVTKWTPLCVFNFSHLFGFNPMPPCPARSVTIIDTKIGSTIYPVTNTQEITATWKEASFFCWSKKATSFKNQKSQSDCLFSLFSSPSLFASNWSKCFMMQLLCIFNFFPCMFIYVLSFYTTTIRFVILFSLFFSFGFEQ